VSHANWIRDGSGDLGAELHLFSDIFHLLLDLVDITGGAAKRDAGSERE
jgi:hypothetical protein